MSKTIYSEAHKNIIDRLKKARKESGLSQLEAANLLGRTQSHISKIESGQRRIDIVALKDFARIYNKTVNYFLND